MARWHTKENREKKSEEENIVDIVFISSYCSFMIFIPFQVAPAESVPIGYIENVPVYGVPCLFI